MIIQLSIFDNFGFVENDLIDTPIKKDWFSRCLSVAFAMPDRFYWSEFRARCPQAPVDGGENWYRELASILTTHGFVKSEERRHSPIPSRQGGDDFLWCSKYTNYTL